MSWKDRAKSASEAAARAKESDFVKNTDLTGLTEAAKDASGVQNRKGQTKKWRVARAAANPVAVGGKVAKAVVKESSKQQKRARGPSETD